MISPQLRGKKGDLATQGSEEELKRNTLIIKAEEVVASAFYLVPLTPSLSPAGRGKG